jgi:hypothetical protein
MTLEAMLLLFLFVFVVLGAFTKPSPTFLNYSPRLGARIENHIAVGNQFIVHDTSGGTTGSLQWVPQSGKPPTGAFQ